MSAIALHDILEDFEPVAAPRPRRHLRVVTPGETAPRPARAVAPRRRRGMVLTRRGRLAVTLTVASALVVAAVVVVGLLPVAAGGTATIVVQPGQTLSEIATTQLPQLPVDRAIVEIQLANELNSLHIPAGVQLQIPRP